MCANSSQPKNAIPTQWVGSFSEGGFLFIKTPIALEIEKTQLNINSCSDKDEGLNVSTTPLRQWGIRQCLPFSWTTLRGKHCRHPIAVMGVVDTFGHYDP